jgi:hypothetical protein
LDTFTAHDQILFFIPSVLIPLQSQPEKGRRFRWFYHVKSDFAIKTDQMRIRDAEADSAIELLGDSGEKCFPDALALKLRVNLHAAQHYYVFFRHQPNDTDELTVVFGQEHRILRLNPAAVLPLGIEVQRSRDLLRHRASDVDRHTGNSLGWPLNPQPFDFVW